MQFTVRPKRALAAPLAVAALGALATPAVAAPPTPGGGSIGDTLYPTLGNTGYDARHYDVNLTFGAKPTDLFTGTVSITAKATKALSRFSLDYAGSSAGTVTVNGAPAAAKQVGEKLVITPGRPIASGAEFKVRFLGFSAKASAPDGGFVGPSVALGAGTAGIFTAGQPAYEHFWLPSNDTPADKATFSFVLTAPSDQVAVANGTLQGKKTVGKNIRWSYLMRQRMATELIQLAVGKYSLIDRGTVDGVQIRDVVAKTPATQAIGPKLGVEKSQLSWMTSKVGAYPFDAYGSLIIDADIGFALETQTLSLFEPVIFDPNWQYYSEGYWKATMLHELAHQWFGDSVAPSNWVDIWLNEGHATWYEMTWAAQYPGYLEGDTFIADDFDEVNQAYYASADQDRADYGPVGRPRSGADDDIFSPQSYQGGELVLYALRQKIGTAKFEKLERIWAAKYKGSNATTKDYIALASTVSGQNLTKFLGDWIYCTKTPPMPGHPDWTVDPVQNTAAARVVPATAGMRADGIRR